jgi:hypothetical protein
MDIQHDEPATSREAVQPVRKHGVERVIDGQRPLHHLG